MAFLPLALQHDWGSPEAKSPIKARSGLRGALVEERLGAVIVQRAKYVKSYSMVTNEVFAMQELTQPGDKPGGEEGVSFDHDRAASRSKATRPLGMLRGTFSVPPDFNAPLPADIQSFFEGEHG